MLKRTVLFLMLFTLAHATAQTQPEPEKKQEKEKQEIISEIIEKKAREGALRDVPEMLFRLNVQVSDIDSLLKSLKLPNEVVLDKDRIRIDGKEYSLKDLAQSYGRTEREGIFKFGDDVVVGRNELVKGDVVVVGGDAIIYGNVRGGIIVILGNIRLRSTSYVSNDVVCIWGNTELDRGARIAGKTNVMNFGKLFNSTMQTDFVSGIYYMLRFLRVFVLYLIALIICTAFPEQTGKIRDRLKGQYMKTLVVGFVGIFLLPVLFIVLLATILGIPIAVLLLPLVTIGGFFMGGTAFALFLGENLQSRIGLKTKSRALLLAIGILLLELPSLLEKISSLFSPALTVLFGALGILLILLIWIPGFGAVILTRFGTRT